ncbi:MAG TPA: pyridoxamine 5'-phosphate oxidase family protein [Ignavibacteriaceae bacterium]|nr:pyridoxamine 5'-phosphate oxidase family protein [Ignavibacteriaceae bacterium]
MNYSNESVRRQDRLLTENDAKLLLKNGEYGVLSIIDDNGNPYGVPISYAWDEKDSIYLHSALEGKKISNLKKNPNVSFTIVGMTNVLQKKFSTEYESIILECKASLNLSIEEKMKGLILLVEKYSPNDIESGKKYAENVIDETEVIKLLVLNWSGKGRKLQGGT